MRILENLIGLFELGHALGPFQTIIEYPNFYAVLLRKLSPAQIALQAGLVRSMADHVANDEILPFGQTKGSAAQLRDIIDEIWGRRAADNSLTQPFAQTELDRLGAATTELIYNLRHELNEMPVFLVTKRGAYDTLILLNDAEKVLNPSHIPLLSEKTVFDIREAGICLAFNVPTAVGFHSVRAVEAVARGYQEVITGSRPGAETPIGPLVKNLRLTRDALLAAKKIDNNDLLNLSIEFLARINNIYRKPISHPDMALDLPTAMTVFDTAKCAIGLMLDDSQKKYTKPPLPKGFF